jgi:hypothetical protein
MYGRQAFGGWDQSDETNADQESRHNTHQQYHNRLDAKNDPIRVKEFAETTQASTV